MALAIGALAALISCNDHPAQPTPVCSYALSAPGQSFSTEGGAGAVAITTDASCGWSIAGAAGWVTLQSPASGTGPSSVSFTVLPNADQAAREMMLTIATVPFRVSQDGRAPCTFSIAPEQKTFGDEGGNGEVAVTAATGCAWTATSTVPWITVTAGAQGQGTGTVKYTVTANNATTARSGTITIANRTLTVSQDGEKVNPADCQYSVSPVTFSPCMPRGTVTATVTTQTSCTWTAAPGVSWLSLPSGRSGTGSGAITIAFSDNYDAPREGTVMVRWPTPTQGQNIQVEQAGCLYGVSKDTISMAAAGGTGTFDVLQQSVPNTCGGALQDRCVWTARSTVSWITVTSSMPRTGDNPVAFTVSANTGAARTGTITVRDKVVTVTQAAP